MIAEDTCWDADTIRVTADLTIADGVILSIDPGVCVLFEGYYALQVAGSLQAVGTAQQRIEWMSAAPEGFAVDSSLTGAWRGIRFARTAATNPPSRLAYCRIRHCKGVGDSARGGALYLEDFSGLEVRNTIFTSNVADYGAVLFCAHGAAPRLVGNLMLANTAFVGGAVAFCLDAYPHLIASTIVANPVTNLDAFYDTGVIHAHLSKPDLTGCILWDNPNAYFLPQQIRTGKGFYVTYNDIGGGHAGTGNFDADPLFLDGGPHPYRILGDSPCRDAGTPDTVGLGLPATDLAGDTRLVAARLDVGAYEYAPAASEVGSPAPPLPAAQIAAPARVRLWAHPNPTPGPVRLSFDLPRVTAVHIALVGPDGRCVRHLLNTVREAGRGLVTWDGRDDAGRLVPTGIYFGRLVTPTERRSVPIHILR